MKPLKLNIQTFDGGLSATINVDYETVGHPKTTSVRAIVTCEDYLFGENNVPEGYTLTSNNVMEKTFTSNTTETITVECYPSGNTSASFSQDVTITVNQIGQKNTREVAYAFCGSKCAHETYTKDQIDALFSVKEETVMIPFTFRVQKKNSSGAYVEDVLTKQINFPCKYKKCFNNVLLDMYVKVKFFDQTNLTYEYVTEYGSYGISIKLPTSYVGNPYRWIAETNQVPEKYKTDIDVDNRDVKPSEYEYVWVRIRGTRIDLYDMNHSANNFQTVHSYFGANAD